MGSSEGFDGRFISGLGTQVKGHNERRFSVKFESPGPKMREIVLGVCGTFGLLAERDEARLQGSVLSLRF